MNNDLKIIKKKYGEDMMKFCRQSFPTLLETPGLLPQILLENFAEYRGLHQDILEAGLKEEFRKYIFFIANQKLSSKYKIENEIQKTPKELLATVGYDLYECHTEEEIQSFKKYYAPGEELCTFDGGRLARCRVFFAVKKDVDNIKREDFPNPDRQDLYGTSVISIQFNKDELNVVSIKNRYNHIVNNPDATFSNNLNNIIPGLERSFEKTYYLNISIKNFGFKESEFKIPKYQKCADGKNYKYYRTLGNYKFGTNNVVINAEGKVTQYNKDNYIVFENYILDLKNKKFILLDGIEKDYFLENLDTISKISVTKEGDFRKIEIFPETDTEYNNPIIIKIDKDNRITELKHHYIKKISDYSFHQLGKIKEIELLNLEEIGVSSFNDLPNLEILKTPKLRKIGTGSFNNLNKLIEIELPNLEEIGDYNFNSLLNLKILNLPKLRKVESDSFRNLRQIKEIELPNLEEVGCLSFINLSNLEILNLPKLRKLGSYSFQNLGKIKEIKLPSLEEVGKGNFPNLHSIPNLEKMFKKLTEIEDIDSSNDLFDSREEEINNEKVNHRRN